MRKYRLLYGSAVLRTIHLLFFFASDKLLTLAKASGRLLMPGKASGKLGLCARFVVMFLFLRSNAGAQSLTISGSVTDTKTGEPIPYVTVVFKNTKTGTTTDTLGRYSIKAPMNADTLRFSAIGYYPVDKVLPSSSATAKLAIDIKLKEEIIDLREIQIAPDDGPIRRLMQKVVANKDKNNPAKHQKYAYRKYSQWEYQITNVSERIMNWGMFKNHQSVFKTAEDGSRFLPLYFSEQLVYNEIQKNPPKQKSTVLADNTKGVGLLNELEIGGYTSALDVDVNFYDNTITLFEQGLISPIADNGWFYYKYFLADSTIVDGHKHYRVNFQPRRTRESTFKGYFITDDEYYSIVEVDADLSSTTNINFLKRLRLKSDYTFVDNSRPFYKRNQVDALFDVIPFESRNKEKQRLSVSYSQSATFDQVNIDQEADVKLENPRARYETIKLPGSNFKDSIFWKQNRLQPLNQKQQVTLQVIDSVSQIQAVKIGNNLMNMGLTKYYDIGKFEIGPITSFFNSNKVEDVNIFFGMRTSSEISEKMMIWGGLGYGVRNKKFNGMAGIGYRFNSINRRVIQLSYDDKMIRHDESIKLLNLLENNFTTNSNNVVSQLFTREELDEILREQKVVASYEHEWYPGLMNRLTVGYSSHYSPEFYPFYRNGLPLDHASAFEVSLNTRFSKEEKIIDRGFLRLYLSTRYPIVHFNVAGGKTYYENNSDWYGRLGATIKHEIFFGQSELDYAVEAGMYFGKMPYTMLDIPRGNETYGYFYYNLNMMNYLEYTLDKYLRVYAEYNMKGFFFRRMPLFKKTTLRELFSVRFMLGSVSNKHQDVITFPDEVTKMYNPYVELGFGVGNIFKLMRVDLLWRVHPQSVVGAPTLGIRGKFQVNM